jgi:hypothetical protein
LGVRDLGRDDAAAADDLDAFWAAAPRLYDFSQQQHQPEEEEEERRLLTRPPSAPPADARRSTPPEPEPCGSSPGPIITLLKRRSSPRRSGSPEPRTPLCLLTLLQHEGSSSSRSPLPSSQEDTDTQLGAAERSPSPDTAACTPCLLLALQRTCVGWGATRRVEYPNRHRPASRGVPAVERFAAAARCGGDDQEHASSGGGAKKRKRMEEVAKEEEGGGGARERP